MTPLARILARRIAATGPIGIADYMADCLLHPEHGYYATRDPFGAAGDFTTAPEISQMFGELVGLALAQSWLDQGALSPFSLAELGPGRGTLMADLLRATKGVAGFHAAARLHLIEASPVLRTCQAQALNGFPCTWLTDADHLPDQPLFAIANEFFDALPIRQFTRDPAGWRETLIGETGGTLTPGLSAAAPLAALSHRLCDTKPGDIVETCPSAAPIVEALGQRIAAHGGAALIIDYGNWGSKGDTFQALQSHVFTDPFAAPGLADLTAHVDFRALATASPTAHAFTDQGTFLTRLGIAARSARLAAQLTGAARENHLAATHRLTAPAEMGSLFKVLALYPANAPPPPGLN
jgi:SAM-dependent MidA family methyltransferase